MSVDNLSSNINQKPLKTKQNIEENEEKPLILNRQETNNNIKINNNNSSNNILTLKNNDQQNKEKVKIMKAQTMGSQRCDRFGNPIGNKSGQYHVTFLDRVSKNNFVEIIKVDNFKEYNKMEEVSANKGSSAGCCLIV